MVYQKNTMEKLILYRKELEQMLGKKGFNNYKDKIFILNTIDVIDIELKNNKNTESKEILCDILASIIKNYNEKAS